MVKFQKKIVQTNFLSFCAYQKIEVDSLMAILNFSNTLKKSPAHLHMVGNVIVKFEKFLTSSKIVGVDLWQPF